MIAITFALPEESRDFAGSLRHPGVTGAPSCEALLGNTGAGECLLFHTGMGQARARERVARLLREHPVKRLISAGYAGGLDPALAAGSLFLARNYSDSRWLAQAQAALKGRARIGVLATAPNVLETRDEKARFARQTGADAVDMETAAIHALCLEHGVPMLSLRVISDPAGEELTVPFSVCFDAVTERPRPAALLGFLLRNPSRVTGFIQFALRMSRVRGVLTDALLRVVDR
jgi:adenosylhomocysteine nucleosidase